MNRLFACALLLSSAAACTSQPPFVVLTVEDEEDVAIGAVTLAIGSDPRALAQRGILGRDFPITVTLTSESEDKKVVWVEAWDFGDQLVARGRAEVAFDDERPPTAVIRLGRACEATDDCEDRVYCNGPATCENRVCIPGEKPCAPSPFACVNINCIEEGRTCGVGVDHAQCDPLIDEATTYCDPAAGCVRGTPCSGGQECQDGSACNGVEECVSNHCVAGPPPNVDDGSPCTIDACVEPTGPGHFPDSFNEGRECMAANSAAGLCNNGRCLTSDCGDGLVDPRTEACDDANDNANDACHECRLTTWAPGLMTGYGIGGGDPLSISLGYVVGLAVDRRGTLYVADGENGLVFALDPATRLATVVAGNGALPFDVAVVVNGGPASELGFGYLNGVAADSSSNLFVSDDNYSRVFRVDAQTGLATPYAGNGNFVPGPLGPALATTISYVSDLFVDGRGNLFVSTLFFPAWVVRVDATTLQVSLVAGNADNSGFFGDGGPGNLAWLDSPTGIAVDGDGNVYIADSYINRVRRVDAFTGIIDTIAGNGNFGSGGDGFDARMAEVAQPADVALDREDGLYIADGYNAVRRVNLLTNTISTYIGEEAGLSTPSHLAVDRDSNLFIADLDNARIVKKHRATGALETVLGGTVSTGERVVRSTSTPLYGVDHIVTDGQGQIYFETTNTIQKLDPVNLTTVTLVATGTATIDAFALAANGDLYYAVEGTLWRRPNSGMRIPVQIAGGLDFARDLAIDRDGNVLIAEADDPPHRIRRINAGTGAISIVAGADISGFAGDGMLATTARFNEPAGLAVDSAGNIYIADFGNDRVRKIDFATQMISTVAGNGTSMVTGNGGPATSAGVPNPRAVAIAPNGDLLIACEGEVRLVNSNGIIDTVAGNGTEYDNSGDGGPATDAAGYWWGVAGSVNGDVFIAADDRVRKIDMARVITTVAGLIEPIGDGRLPQTKLSAPASVVEVIDGTGRPLLLFADGASGRIRAIDEALGTQYTVLGYPDGSAEEGAEARYARLLLDPRGIVFDPNNKKVYVSEAGGGTISVVDVSAATWTLSSYAEGLVSPEGMAIDHARGVLYIADSGEHVISKIDLADPTVTRVIVAGQSRARGYFGEGMLATEALLSSPRAVALGRAGNVYIADFGNRRVRRVDSTGRIYDVFGDGSTGSGGSGGPARILPCDEPLGLSVDAFGNLFVASKDTLRIVTAGEDGIAAGDDEVLLIYGIPPRERFPEPLTSCLAGNAITSDSRVIQLDRCRGFLIELNRGQQPFGSAR